jgi:phosphate transport system permease protein
MTSTVQSLSSRKWLKSKAGYQRRRITNLVMLTFTGLLTILALIPLVWIMVYVIIKGAQYINLAFFTQMPRPLGLPGGGVLNAIEGTIVLTFLAALFSIPPAILAAIYTAYYPNTPLGVAARFSTDVLSGIPTIIIGLFCYGLIVKPQGHYSALAGGISLAIVMFPIIVRTTEEMIKLVPQPLREGSLALGAAEWKTSLSVVVPAAANGIITGILLGLARASGETAPLLFTALGNENYNLGNIIRSGIASQQGIVEIIRRVFETPVDSLPLTLYKYSQQPFPERINQAWAVSLVLMAFVFVINIFSRIYVMRRTSRLQGK